MSRVRPMKADDVLRFGTCNLDNLTETYSVSFYLQYLTNWPDLCRVIEGPDGKIEGYILGKLEDSPYPCPVSPYDPDTNTDPNYLPWHGHITALTVAPTARRLGHATKLSRFVEQQSDAMQAWFVDLFVRANNVAAQRLYKQMGYTVYRRVKNYYGDRMDALDMRKPMSLDKDEKHVSKNGKVLVVRPDVVW